MFRPGRSAGTGPAPVGAARTLAGRYLSVLLDRSSSPLPTLQPKLLEHNIACNTTHQARYGDTALQDGLLGFRGIPASIIGVTEALAKAYPLLVGPALERAKANAGQGQHLLEDAWLREVDIPALVLAQTKQALVNENCRQSTPRGSLHHLLHQEARNGRTLAMGQRRIANVRLCQPAGAYTQTSYECRICSYGGCKPIIAVAQAVRDGSLAQALGSLRSQPQVLAAYSRTAPLRDRQRVTELQAALLRFKALLLALIPQ